MMECLYSPNLTIDAQHVMLDQDESKHAKVLRLHVGDAILISSGTGILAKGIIHGVDQGIYSIMIQEIRKDAHELSFRFGIAMPLLSTKERMEFALEKLTELGITDIHLFESEHTQTHSPDIKRLRAKVLSAMKQCKRSILPHIHSTVSLTSIQEVANEYSVMILGDVQGMNSIPAEISAKFRDKGVLLCIGPEGGFSHQETAILRSFSHVFPIRIGHTRLRAETAAMAIASIISFHGE